MHQVNVLQATNAPCVSTARKSPFTNLESCSSMADLKQYHAHIIKLGLSYDNDAMGRVVKFCCVSECGDFNYALKVFDKLPHPDAYVYNTIFRGYLRAHMYEDCIILYVHMLKNFVKLNQFTFPPVIRACCARGCLKEGKQVHCQVIKHGFAQDSFCQNNLIYLYGRRLDSSEDADRILDHFPNKDDVTWTTLITGLARSGRLDEAVSLFESIPEKSSASWNAVIAACVQNNRFNEAFSLFSRMKKEKIFMDKFVAASMLSACTALGALEQGEQIHGLIKSSGIEMNPKLSTTIMDMYCKCGRLDKALEVFNEMATRTVSSWNCMIGGFAMHGKGNEAIDLLKRMESDSELKPDYVTFVNVLAACAHSGLVEEGEHYFSCMRRVYGIEPGMEHYGCLVDLLGRAGFLEKAKQVIAEMPYKPDAGVLCALLGACRIHGNFEIAEEIGWQVIELDPTSSGRYALLSNVYAKACKWDEVAKIRKLMDERGVKKVAGSSSIELNGIVNEFIANGRTHPETKNIYEKIREMLARIRDLGYTPDSDEASLHGLSEDEEAENPLQYHSEKLAIAYGLLKTKAGGDPVRVTKNLRVCRDCHEASKLISACYDREIIVRDRNRFHHFRRGVCSCNDFW
ncbi:hypothetical protein M569_05535 [Genlisea aurea]|uniref:DYW domain-containing protein n=1 Tax=Genlisea aurea TaxID=192259 RepID=S8CW96_9LAMI|nr:hypothetical protein M569_05535 [Genlisea aurea]